MFKKIFLLIFLILLLGYFFLNNLIGSGNLSFVGTYLNVNQVQKIKKYIFPYKLISQQKKELDIYKQLYPHFESELIFKASLENIKIEKIKDLKLSEDVILSKYIFNNGFYSGVAGKKPGGYLEFYDNNLFILSSRGILAFNDDLNKNLHFKQIENNINSFISLNQFNKDIWFSLKDLHIHDDRIYVSYTEEIREDCWNTSIISGEFNYEKIIFKKFFSSENCINSKNNIDNEFNGGQSGGRIVNYDNNHILFSVGEYRSRYLAQEIDNINGKILKININNSDYEIVSVGHRNPQGMYFDKGRNIIICTEHGPDGGDEINIIDLAKLNEKKILNYGWPIASYGEHYGGKNKKKYEKYPLFKSHKKNNFIEPLKSFSPSIAISEIVKIDENTYVFGSMGNERKGDKSLYFLNLNNEKKIKKLKVFQRVRDLTTDGNKLFIFFENPSSLGVLDLT